MTRPPLVARLWVTYGPALALALLTAIGVLGGKVVGGWEQQDRQAQAQVQALRQEVVDTKYRLVVLEVQLATLKEALAERAAHDRNQWRSIEALERRRR